MKFLKKTTFVLFTVCVLVLCTVFLAANASAAEVTASGTFSGALTWTLYDTGELVIGGEGEMEHFTSYPAVPWYSKRSSVKTLTIEDGVTSLGKFAFYSCTKLTSVTIPANIASIHDRAFSYCSGITEFKVDENSPYFSVDEIGVLYNKDKTVLVNFPAGNPATEYHIPEGVTFVGDCAFLSCPNLTTVTVPDSVTQLGDDAFYSCTKLTDVTLGNSIEIIGDEAFLRCKALESITLPDSVTVIGYNAFSNTSLTSITVPDSVISILHHAFTSCKNLTSVTLGQNVTTIEEQAFASCKGLTSITLPESVTSIGAQAFGYCSGLTEVTVLSRDAVYADDVFRNAVNLTLYGYAGSTTEAYAVSQNINFVALEENTFTIGDINGDSTVDIDDAMHLFRYSMMPDLYPIDYAENIDFTKDGNVDIDDALWLFQYSMNSDAYPIE